MRLRWLLVPLLLSGCVFRDAAEPRFYRPASSLLDAAAAPPATHAAVAVRLLPVEGTPFLRERIAWRSSDVEYGLYEQRRWSELPASYVQRALANALRDTPGLRLTDDLDAPALRVEVVAFDEDLAPVHQASVALAVSLRDRARRRLIDQTFAATAAIAGGRTRDSGTAGRAAPATGGRRRPRTPGTRAPR
jgi:ABC-type uncharacterized transport system auxiliary subunit